MFFSIESFHAAIERKIKGVGDSLSSMPGETGSPQEVEPIPYFQQEITRLGEIIAAFDEGKRPNTAIIGDPFAGQNIITKELRRLYPDRITYMPFFTIVTGKDFLSNLYQAKDIVVMEKCHFLALRRIGGFEMLDEFLDHLSMSENLFITTWNSYSWSYINAVRNIASFFPEIIQLPKLDNASLKALILSRYGHEIQFVDDTAYVEQPLFEKKRVSVLLPIIPGPVSIPWFSINYPAEGKPIPDKVSAEDKICDKINRIANGNYGVALRLWERSMELPTIRLSSIPETPCSIELNINEAFLLTIILSMEAIKLVDLAEIAGPEIDIEQTLYRLLNQGLVENEKDFYQIRPEALNCAIDYLKKIRMVW